MENKTIKVKNQKIYKEGELYRVIISKEIEDRDGEIILIDGIDTSEYIQNPIVVCQHDTRGTITKTLVGKITKIETGYDQGVKVLYGFIEFAETKYAKEIKALVDGEFLKSVSMGFGKPLYEGNTITSCKLYEVSIVLIPSNPEAQFKSDNIEIKYKEIKTKIKAYRELLMNKDIWAALNIVKKGNEIEDIITLVNSIKSLTINNNINLKSNQSENQTDSANTIENQSKSITDKKLIKKLMERIKNF